MKSLKDLILARTPILSIPSKMSFYSSNGKLKEVSTLTKGGSISTRNKEKVIQFIGNDDDVFNIENKGYSVNDKPETKVILKIKKDNAYKKEQEMMGGEDVDIKGSTMREKKEEQDMGAEDVDIKNEFEKILKFLELKNINIPAIKSKREMELFHTHHNDLRDMLADVKGVEKMKKEDLITTILKREGIKKGITANYDNGLYRDLKELHGYINDKVYTNYMKDKEQIKKYEKKLKEFEKNNNRIGTTKEKENYDDEFKRIVAMLNMFRKKEHFVFHLLYHKIKKLLKNDYTKIIKYNDPNVIRDETYIF